MNQGIIPDVNSGNIEDQVRAIIGKKGSDGWIRVSKCEKEYENSSQDENQGTVRTRFYRWLARVEKRKVPDFQVIKFPNNLSYVGLSNSNPKKLDYLVANNKKIVQKLSFSDIFYSNAFRKLDEICSMANGQKAYASPDRALLELNTFIATLPRELKEKLKPLQDQALDSVKKYAGEPLQPKYWCSVREMLDEIEADKVPDIEFMNTCYNWVLKLVNEVSSLLHESKDNLTLFGLNRAEEKSKENSLSSN